MGQAKNYLNNIVCACSEEAFGQDAVQHAIDMGHVKLTGDRDADLQRIMGQYDQIIETYQREASRNEAMLVDSYGPLLNEIRRAA